MNSFKEKTFKALTYVASLFTIVFLFGIIGSLFVEGLPLLGLVRFKDFLFNPAWHPTHYPPDFGILSLIVGSVVVTIGALILAIPLGLGSAVYISEIAGNRTR